MLKPRTKEGKYIQKYFYLRGEGFSHKDASEIAKKEIEEKLDFDEEKFKKRIKQYKLAYGSCMYMSFVYLAYGISVFNLISIISFFLVIVYLYKVLMKLRYWSETYGVYYFRSVI
jgi:hypothetical protein